MHIDLPADLYDINRIFLQHGYQLFLVGGAIRNIFLGLDPGDFDLASDAKPEDVQRIFHTVIPTGLAYGTVTLRWKKKSYEITTFRKDGTYREYRHPQYITFSKDIRTDLERRDFTINAFAYDISRHILLDLFNGASDLKLALIRTIGSASQRFTEDALRMLRAIRFATVLNFSIEKETFRSLQKHRELIKHVASERILSEVLKLFSSEHCLKGIMLLEESKLLDFCMPVLQERELCRFIARIPQNHLASRLALYFHACRISTKEVEVSLSRLQCPKKLQNTVIALHRFLGEDELPAHREASLRKMLAVLGKTHLADLLPLLDALYADPSLCARITAESHHPLSIKELAVNGTEIMQEVNLPSGPLLGATLKHLMQLVLENPKLNTKKHLLRESKRYYLNSKTNRKTSL